MTQEPDESRRTEGGTADRRLSWPLPLRLLPQAWADDHELAHAILGTVVGAAAMATASLHGTLAQVVWSVIVTVLVYWAAERYARVLGVAAHQPPGRARILAVLRRGWPMVQAAYTPLVVLVVAYLVTADLFFGVVSALVVATLLLGALGDHAARRAGASRPAALGWGAASAALGVVVIVLKLSLH